MLLLTFLLLIATYCTGRLGTFFLSTKGELVLCPRLSFAQASGTQT